MIEDLTAILLAALACVGGAMTTYFMVVSRNPRVKALREHVDFYSKSIDDYRSEIKRLKGKLAVMSKGTIPYEAIDSSSDGAFLDAIIGAMPPNIRAIVNRMGLKEQAVAFLKDHPELKDQVIDIIKKQAGAAGGKTTTDQGPEGQATLQTESL